MRRLAIGLTLGVAMLWAAPAEANGWNNLRAGTQGIIQSPVDVLWYVFVPPEDWVDELPGGSVTARIFGLPAGTALGVYRILMGATDIALFPLWVFPAMSPEARWNWFGVEYEDI